MEVVHCLRNPERYARVGARCPRGVLLAGADVLHLVDPRAGVVPMQMQSEAARPVIMIKKRGIRPPKR